MKPLTITGEMCCIGDMSDDEAQELAGQPRITLRLPEGRFVTIAGLTHEECRACADGFLEQVTVEVRKP